MKDDGRRLALAVALLIVGMGGWVWVNLTHAQTHAPRPKCYDVNIEVFEYQAFRETYAKDRKIQGVICER